jgi:hypothetical protein
MKKSILIIFVSICLGASFNVSAKKKSDKHLVLNLIGTSTGYAGWVPDHTGDGVDDPATCFDVDLWDLKKNKKVGKATDCLSDLTPFGGVDLLGTALIGTTYFNMGKKGTLITRGNTSVQPVGHLTVTPHGQNITHTTGASSDENAILGGTRKFKNATGTARLSGMVDLTYLMSEGKISFDCIFVIDLE